MIGSSYTRTQLHQPSAKVSSPQLAPQFNVVSGLQCIVEKVIQKIHFARFMCVLRVFLSSFFSCPPTKETSLFGEFGFIPEPLLKMETQTRNLLPRVAFQRSIFGQGVLVSRSAEGLALISVVDGENSVVQDVVTSVFNGSYFLDLHFEQHDKDLFYFVKVLKLCAPAVVAYPTGARTRRLFVSNLRHSCPYSPVGFWYFY